VPTPGVWGLTFWGNSIYVDPQDYQRKKSEIWSAMFPGTPEDYGDFLRKSGLPPNTALHSADVSKWRNEWCDVHSAYSHLAAQRDFFVTLNSSDFEKPQLTAIGVVAVTPDEAINRI
jgi:hypothetical protein